MFIGTIISFAIVAFAVFLIIRSLNKLKQEEENTPDEPTTQERPHCFLTLPIMATRCPESIPRYVSDPTGTGEQRRDSF